MGSTRRLIGLALGALALVATATVPAYAHDPSTPEGKAEAAELTREYVPSWVAGPKITGQPTPCVNGKADKYLCKNVDLLSFLPHSQLGGGSTSSSMWNWTDSTTQNEYIIYCRSNGVSFINVTDASNPKYLGNLPAANGTSSTWCDVRVYQDHAYIGKDTVNAGIQVFDLRRLRGVTTTQTFTADAQYAGLTNSHTLWINTETGYLYVSGANTCNKGLTILDIHDLLVPKQVACYDKEVYSHEAIVLNYHGPDTRFAGREICFNFAGQGKKFQILDVTDKANIKVLSSATYSGASFTHQGYPTPDMKYLVMNDETISTTGGSPDFVWNIEKLDALTLVGVDKSSRGEFISHNGYIVGNRHYQAAYKGGLRIMDTSAASSAKLPEVGFFDINPSSDANGFSDTWMINPYLKNGVIAVQGMGVGLFLVKPTGAAVGTR